MRHWHLRDIRFANNAGINMPLCRVAVRASTMQDLDATRLRTTGDFSAVTCPRCRARAPRHYPWAYRDRQKENT